MVLMRVLEGHGAEGSGVVGGAGVLELEVDQGSEEVGVTGVVGDGDVVVGFKVVSTVQMVMAVWADSSSRMGISSSQMIKQ